MVELIETYRERKMREAEAARNAKTAKRLDDLASSVAERESSVAERSHAIGDLFSIGGTVYRATDVIGRGERIDGSNSASVTVADIIAEIREQ